MSYTDMLGLGQTALELGLVSSLTVLALFLSYSMLNVCDLSTDGCFTLGAVVGTVSAISLPQAFVAAAAANPALTGFMQVMTALTPFLSMLLSMLAGMTSGFVTAFLQTRMGIQSLLAGIVVNTSLYSVNMAISGNKAQLSLNKIETVFTLSKDLLKDSALAPYSRLIVELIAVALAALFLCMFLRTRLGLSIRATGSNADMVRSSSINPMFTTTVGLCISNSLTGLSGCLMAQQQKSFDINMGSGMVTIALAMLLIGGVFFGKSKSIPKRVLGAVLGAFIFRLVYTIALRLHMPAFMLKAVSGIIVIIAISGPYLAAQAKRFSRGARSAREGGKGIC